MWLLKQIKQEPVLFQMVVQAFFPLLFALGITLKTFSGEEMNEQTLGILYAFTAALLSFITRTQVTPLANPRDNDGKRLTPSS